MTAAMPLTMRCLIEVLSSRTAATAAGTRVAHPRARRSPRTRMPAARPTGIG
ncbi:hypothetical protein FM106_30050 [Brachybacterium faecium]|nr:hypothetical protein FM106_30050 [Brachybacterium faecium]